MIFDPNELIKQTNRLHLALPLDMFATKQFTSIAWCFKARLKKRLESTKFLNQNLIKLDSKL